MSTSPETSERVDDRLVNVISRWLARHLPDEELRLELDRVEPGALEPGQEEAIEELGSELGQDRDGTGRVRSLEPEGDGARLCLDVPAELLRYCVEKGSLAVDGVSLTIAELDGRGVAIALVPHTLRETTLAALRPGDGVNLEVDVLAKYVEKLTAR